MLGFVSEKNILEKSKKQCEQTCNQNHTKTIKEVSFLSEKVEELNKKIDKILEKQNNKKK